jgi:single-strand selective monofunctional uracil DNA glycosylase
MGQTGIPFGEVSFVRDYLQITGDVKTPSREHPKRKVLGLGCTRSEVSGKRLWGAISAKHPNPRTFFERAFVANYCPLLFLSESGSNLTPDKLAKAERKQIEDTCDEHLAALIKVTGVRLAIGVGGYAEKRLRVVLGDSFPVSSIPHPSPASPQANRGWTALAQAALTDAGISGLL